MASAQWRGYVVNRANVYLLLAVLGAALPYSQFIPWLSEHGLNVPRLIFEILHSRISTFAWLDVAVSVVTILFFVAWESRRLGMPFPIWPVLGSLVIGASSGLPFFLYQRERYLNRD